MSIIQRRWLKKKELKALGYEFGSVERNGPKFYDAWWSLAYILPKMIPVGRYGRTINQKERDHLDGHYEDTVELED